MSFTFKQFHVDDSHCAMKIGTDGVLVGSWTDVEHADSVLDVGAGSGLISLMIAQRTRPAVKIQSIEICPEAVEDMERNFAVSPWADRLSALSGDFCKFDKQVDLIVSNPPFFSAGLTAPDASRAMARHGNGLNPYTLIDFATTHLNPGGSLAMITDYDDHADITYHAEMAGLKIRRFAKVVSRDGAQPIRALWQMRRQDGHIEVETIVIHKPDGGYTERFRQLTDQFYLDGPKD